MADLLSPLVPYLPPTLLRHMLADPAMPPENSAQRFSAAVLFVDVSGFTPLTEALSHQGSAGAEELNLLMNSYFDRMITLLAAEGGEVVGFSGDAITVLFPALDEPLGYAVRRAYQAAEAMRVAMTAFHSLTTSVGSVALGMKICIGAGEVVTLQVGGIFDRWEYVVAGDPLRQIAAAEPQMTRGALVLSPEAQAIMYPAPLPPRSLALITPADMPDPAGLTAILRRYVSRAVENALRAGKQAWLGELRPMSVLFIGAEGMDYTLEAGIKQLHLLVRRVQSIIYRYEGSLIQVVVDDKGTVILVLFGAPPLAHEDDALRAVRSALDIQAHYQGNTPNTAGITLKLGIASGRVFVGPVGGDIRRTYAAMGDTVNLAARLMGKADTGEVLCDFATYRQAQEKVLFDALPPVRLKGKASLVRLYRPHQSLAVGNADQISLDNMASYADLPFVGRHTEIAQLQDSLAALEAGRGSVLIIQGEAGMGKSRLMRELMRSVRERGLTSLSGAGQSIEQQTPYRAWRDIFMVFFALDASAPLAMQQAQVQALVREIAPDQYERLPLLNDLLNLGLPDTALTATLDPALRQQNLGLLLLGLLHGWAHDSPLILVLEDAHWLDSLSWEFLIQIARSLAVVSVPIALVLVMRPIEAQAPAEGYAATVRDLPQTTTLALTPLDPDNMTQLVTARLGLAAGTLPAAVADLVHQYASGNPFFAEELVLALRDQGSMSIEPDPADPLVRQCRVIGDMRQLQENLPTTVHGLILARLDRLVPEAQLLLKVAAVIGRIFGHTILAHAIQRHTFMHEQALPQHLHYLDTLDITSVYTQEHSPAHMFRHIIIQEVTYQTLLFAQRRVLHRTIAQWYEATYGGAEATREGQADQGATSAQPPLPEHQPLAPYYPLLVHHYHFAGDQEHERSYAHLAGVWSAARYANAEAVSYLSRALELTDAHNHVERYALLLVREQVYDRQGNRAAQLTDLAELDYLAEQSQTPAWQAEVSVRQASYSIVTGDYPAAITKAQRAIDRLHDPSMRHALRAHGWDETEHPHWHLAGATDLFMLETRFLADAYLQWGRALRFQADYPAARQQLTQALYLAQAHKLADLEAEVLRQLGAVAFFQDNYAAAQAYDEQALVILRALGDRQGEARTLDSLGCDASEQGDYEGAMAYFDQALDLFQFVGDRWGLMQVLGNLGDLCREQGFYTRAIASFRQGLELCRVIGDIRGEGWTQGNLGWIYLDLGMYSAAAEAFEHALVACEAVGARMDVAWVRVSLGMLKYLQNDHATAHELCEQVFLMVHESGERSLAGDAWLCLGHTLVAEGNLEAARTAYTEALAVWYTVGQINRAMETCAGLARIGLLQHDHAAARTQVDLILAYLDQHSLAGTDEPFRIYLTCYQVLLVSHDSRADQLLHTACTRLRERADRIADEGLRCSYLEHVATHRALLLAEASADPA